jgi:hypothetical protein
VRKKCIEYQDIGNPVDTGFIHLGIAMFETPMGGGNKAVALSDNGHMGQRLSPVG